MKLKALIIDGNELTLEPHLSLLAVLNRSEQGLEFHLTAPLPRPSRSFHRRHRRKLSMGDSRAPHSANQMHLMTAKPRHHGFTGKVGIQDDVAPGLGVGGTQVGHLRHQRGLRLRLRRCIIKV